MALTSADNAIARLLALGGELQPAAPGQLRRKFELAHMRALLQSLGDPQNTFPAVLIAGTNGKGSTAATLASILQAAGMRVGLYTSPHLERPNERIRINGEAIRDEDLATHFEVVEAAGERLVREGALPYTPSFFEVMTAIGFLHFAGAAGRDQASGQTNGVAVKVEIAVLEVGLGGRLDATNVVEPLISVLTDISLDHMQWLGATIGQITREKAGILRPEGTLVTLPQHPEANQVIGEVAVPLRVKAWNAADFLPMRHTGPQVVTKLAASLRNDYDLTLPAESGDLSGLLLPVRSPLAGSHQQRNLALAICAAVALHVERGFPLTIEELASGIRETHWEGRLQLLPPPAAESYRAPVLLDAAHNPAGAWALRSALSSVPVQGPRVLIFGCMADKAVEELAQVLFPVFDEVLLTRAENPRSASVADLLAAADRTCNVFRGFQHAGDALEAALGEAPSDGLIVIAGSIALLGEMRSKLAGRG